MNSYHMPHSLPDRIGPCPVLSNSWSGNCSSLQTQNNASRKWLDLRVRGTTDRWSSSPNCVTFGSYYRVVRGLYSLRPSPQVPQLRESVRLELPTWGGVSTWQRCTRQICCTCCRGADAAILHLKVQRACLPILAIMTLKHMSSFPNYCSYQ